MNSEKSVTHHFQYMEDALEVTEYPFESGESSHLDLKLRQVEYIGYLPGVRECLILKSDDLRCYISAKEGFLNHLYAELCRFRRRQKQREVNE